MMLARVVGFTLFAGIVIDASIDVAGNTVKEMPRVASGGLPLVAVMISG